MMIEAPDPREKTSPPGQDEAPIESEDNSLAAASQEAIRELGRRGEGGGNSGFGDIG